MLRSSRRRATRAAWQVSAEYDACKRAAQRAGVALREGVLHQVAATRRHLSQLYDGQRLEARVARPEQPGQIRHFAEGSGPQLLVLNIDAINKGKGNVLHRPADALGGLSPVARVAHSRPIVILDEPQNLEGPRARAGVGALEPCL